MVKEGTAVMAALGGQAVAEGVVLGITQGRPADAVVPAGQAVMEVMEEKVAGEDKGEPAETLF